MPATVKCPTCRRPVEWTLESLYRPFCSERCRLIDLGAWFSEERKIPDEAGAEPDAATEYESGADQHLPSRSRES